jgi:hypothetical protein
VQSFGVLGVLRTSVRVFSQNIVAFTLIASIIYGPVLVLQLVQPSNFVVSHPVLVDTFLDALIGAAITYGVIMELHGTRPSYRRCVTRGLAGLLPALGAAFLSFVAISIGLVLLVIPGLIVMMNVFVAIPVAVTEKPGMMASLRRSHDLVDGHRLKLFALVLIMWGVSFGMTQMLDDILGSDAAVFVAIGVSALLGVFNAVTAAVAYTHLRNLKDGTQLPEIAQAFARVRE